MKDLGKIRYCIGLQIEHYSNGILVHQLAYIEKVLKQFDMDKSHPVKLYLANCTRPDIAFCVNLLARYSSAPTKRH